MAVFLVFFCIAYKTLGFKQCVEIPSDKTALIHAKLIKIEEKEFSDYLFVNADNYEKAIIVAPKNCDIKIGQKFIAECKNIGFNDARNYGNFDEKNYYQSLGYWYKFKSNKISIESNNYDFIRQNLFAFRKRLIEIFDETINDSKAGIFKAIVVGEKSDIDLETKNLYQKNGIAHILAISGLHISLIGMGIFSILNKRFSIIVSGIVSIAFMILFCIMSGESVSAIRATIMFVLRMIALIFGKSYDMLSALSFAGIVLLITNPLYIYNSSFLLSFFAILAIAVLSLRLHKFLGIDNRKNKILSMMISSISVFILTIPIISNSYFEISIYSVFLNLIVIPLMSFILGSAIFSAFLGILSIVISRFVIGMGAFLLDAINVLCVITDKIPFNSIITGKLSLVKIIVFYTIVALFVFVICKLNIKKIKKVICALLTVGLLLLITFINIPNEKLNISFFDVDQGDAILIKTPNDVTFLIDGGSSSISNVKEYRLESALKYKKVSHIDYAIVTHPDTDHISGLLEFINENNSSIDIDSVYIPLINDNENYEILKKACKENNISFNNISKGMYFEEDGLKITCLHPFTKYKNTKSVNAYSTVLDLEYGDFSALFVGDLEDDGEKILLADNIHEFDLLKVSHHGSKNSSSEEFLKAIKPSYAIISAGINNMYGHPHKETIERLKKINAQIYCTASCGEIDAIIDSKGNVVIEHKI